jgi:hypothetical protein
MTPDVKPKNSKVLVEPPWGGFRFPPLMFVSNHRLRREAIEHIKARVEQAIAERKPFIVEDMKVYQLIDGRWEPLL